MRSPLLPPSGVRGSGRLLAAARADAARLRAAHPRLGAPSPRAVALAAGTVLGALALLLFGLWRLDVSPARLLSGLGQLGGFVGLMLPPSPGTGARALVYLHALAETVAIAFVGTVAAAVLAAPLGVLAARNTTVSGIVRFLTRRSSDAIRGVDQLIWALIWINVVGLGPFAGALAVMTSDVGNFTKLFSDAIEASDKKPVEGVASTGGGRLHAIRFGVVPQVLPVLAAQVLYLFESNVRSSTIIGIVGAGGIGLHLSEQIRTLEWQAVAFILVLILVAVAIIDAVSGRLREAIAGRRSLTV